MTKSITLLMLLFSLVTNAQRQFIKPDYDAIEKAVKDKTSAYYYPPLLERYKRNDSTLTKDEFKYLYYGQFFTDKPDGSNLDKRSALYEQRKKIYSKDTLKEEDYRALLSVGKQLLEIEPFDTKMMNMVFGTYRKLNDTVNAEAYLKTLRRIVSVIMSTGDGKTDETGYHVANVGDEYFMLQVFGYEFSSQKLTQHPCDYMLVKSNEDNVQGVYFDVSQIFKGYNKMLTDEHIGEEFLKSLDKKKGKKK